MHRVLVPWMARNLNSHAKRGVRGQPPRHLPRHPKLAFVPKLDRPKTRLRPKFAFVQNSPSSKTRLRSNRTVAKFCTLHCGQQCNNHGAISGRGRVLGDGECFSWTRLCLRSRGAQPRARCCRRAARSEAADRARGHPAKRHRFGAEFSRAFPPVVACRLLLKSFLVQQ